MRFIERAEVEEIVAKGRAASEHEITKMLDDLEEKHPGVYRVIYGEPSDGIAMINKDMANLYRKYSANPVTRIMRLVFF